ncbi:MAG: PrsW family intramembrane metalloprotease [Haloferacaceae archaeon]
MVDSDGTDPVADASGAGADLYDVATWEERTSLDGLAVGVYKLVVALTRVIVVLTALGILFAIGGLSMLAEPRVRVLTLLSAAPAVALAAYIWYSDVTDSEPLSTLVATFLLGVLMANFAAVVNSVLNPYFELVGVVGSILFFYLVVGPVEETVKLLAVRFHAYRTATFDSVIDGAVYGAMAGLGFATIENVLYIARTLSESGSSGQVIDLVAALPAWGGGLAAAGVAGGGASQIGFGVIGLGGGITLVRALAGPGHVIYSAFAGYYLGLAKFNPENRGPIIVKGLLIAAFIHGTYNNVVGIGSGLIGLLLGIQGLLPYFLFVVVYDGFFGYLLYRKIKRYRNAYWAAHEDDEVEDEEILEDDPGSY